MELEIHELSKLLEHLQRTMENNTGSFYCQDFICQQWPHKYALRLMYFNFHFNFNVHW